MSRLGLALLFAFAGCAAPYDPPVVGDRASAKYQAEILRCRKSADAAATRRINATPQTAIASLFQSPEQEHQDVTLCMQQHGFTLRAGT